MNPRTEKLSKEYVSRTKKLSLESAKSYLTVVMAAIQTQDSAVLKILHSEYMAETREKK